MFEEGVDMKPSDCLDNNTKKKLRNLSSNKIKKPEKFSEKDLAELMGVNSDRYERKGGAVRRK